MKRRGLLAVSLLVAACAGDPRPAAHDGLVFYRSDSGGPTLAGDSRPGSSSAPDGRGPSPDGSFRPPDLDPGLPKPQPGPALYVTASGSGSRSGVDWSNALGGLPAALVRNTTYFVASGSYPSYTFDDAVSGTQLITIKKASAADHGTATGWEASYGVGQATFKSLTIAASYVRIDGTYDHGFKVDLAGGEGYAVHFKPPVSSVTLEHVEIAGPGMSHVYSVGSSGFCSVCGRGINTPSGSAQSNNLVFRHLSIHDFETLISLFSANNVLFEYCKLYNAHAGNPAAAHPNVLQAGANDNVVFRYNDISSWSVEGIMLCPAGACKSTNWYIYGNVWHDALPNGTSRVLESQYSANGPVFLYNNTFVNLWIPVLTASGGSWASGSVGRNNIYWNLKGGGPTLPSESNNLIGSGANTPFADYAGKNYRLRAGSAAINMGAALKADGFIDKDMLGTTRGADGQWDVGAYEYK